MEDGSFLFTQNPAISTEGRGRMANTPASYSGSFWFTGPETGYPV
jgi:hypothetical protein